MAKKMSDAQVAFRNMLIRQIHTSPRWKNHYRENQDDYRKLLHDHFRKESSKDLSITELQQLNAYMQMERSLPRIKPATPQQLYKMSELWALKARTNTDAALLAFAARICRRTPKDLPDLSMDEGQKVIVALSKMGGA